MLWCTIFLAVFANVQGRAVNISNTWVLPEEGFPVFYRYFRDRISWYEADAVCQFHHANLVTVDTTAQYDAVRAYLKELDISSAVWVGLIRSNPNGDFTWTDYRGLSGEGYWSSAPDARIAPLCAAADPAADYRWEARACGGPTVASFICELPVPQWALGSEGCMVRELPALTVLYLPESAAVQLTADCGLAGVRRVQCTGNVKREDLLKNLSCVEEDYSTTLSVSSSAVVWPVTTDTVITDQDTTNEATTDEKATTEHEDDINQMSLIKITAPPYSYNLNAQNTVNRVLLHKNLNFDIIHDNNVQSNDIPKLANNGKFISNEQSQKIEDEKHVQHKMLHDELARLGNFETIFTQPTDHFVPPLVMAKAKISDDMTVLSLKEKHAQQLAEHKSYINKENYHSVTKLDGSDTYTTTTKEPGESTENPLITVMYPNKDDIKNKLKLIVPKKYNEKYSDPKTKISKISNAKQIKFDKTTEKSYLHLETTAETTTTKLLDKANNKTEYDPTIELTVIIKDPTDNEEKILLFNHTQEEPPEILKDSPVEYEPEVHISSTKTLMTYSKTISGESQTKLPTEEPTLSHEVITITIVRDKEDTSSVTPTIFEITTKMPAPAVENNIDVNSTITSDTNENNPNSINVTDNPLVKFSTITEKILTDIPVTFKNAPAEPVTEHTSSDNTNVNETTIIDQTFSTETPKITTAVIQNISASTNEVMTTDENTTLESHPIVIDNMDNITKTEIHDFNKTEEHVNVTDDSLETIDDFQSPLLSAGNEPLHRPNRLRRPQPSPNRTNKFNPFRMLG